MKKASSQLEKVLQKKVGAGHRGIVALDMSKILNPGNGIYVCNNDSHLVHSIGRLMEDLIDKFSPVWERVYQRRDRKIIGTILRFGFMSTSEERNLLIHIAQWGLNPRVKVSSQDDRLQRELVSVLEKSQNNSG